MDQKQRSRPKMRFIPFRKRDVIEMCMATGGLRGSDQFKFRDLCQLMQSVFHFEFHDKLETLKNSYAPLNPDRDTRQLSIFTKDEDAGFASQLDELLNNANYEKLTDEDLEVAFEESSLFKLKLHVDFEDFKQVLIYSRGESIHTETLSSFMGLRKKTITFSNFDRVVIYVEYSEKVLSGKGKSGTTMLKMFQNVPRADIEMLFPNTRLGMRAIDKLMIGIPALVGGGAVLTTKMGASLLLLGGLLGYGLGFSAEPADFNQAALIAAVLSLGGLGSYIWKQFSNFKNRKIAFMKTLTENLYFKNLDNNAGVFHRLIDDAEEEECKEAILAYYFLLTKPDIGSEEELDEVVESWFQERWDSMIDFEVDDGLAKLLKLELIKESDNGYEVVGIEEACEILDKRWDDYFVHSRTLTV
jgi:hypothetical protein